MRQDGRFSGYLRPLISPRVQCGGTDERKEFLEKMAGAPGKVGEWWLLPLETTNPKHTAMKPKFQDSSLSQFLAAAVKEAEAAANLCVALHHGQIPAFTPADWRELNDACDRWLARSRNRQSGNQAA
jgi:hypothetical protein